MSTQETRTIGRFKTWLAGIVGAALVASGGWAWKYAFSAESRLTKVEAVQDANIRQQEEFRQRTDKTLDKLDARTQKMEEYLREIHARTVQSRRQQISGDR